MPIGPMMPTNTMQRPALMGAQPIRPNPMPMQQPAAMQPPGMAMAGGGQVRYLARGGPHFNALMKAPGVKMPGARHAGVRPPKFTIPMAKGGSVSRETPMILCAIRQKQKFAEGGLVKEADNVKAAGRLGDTVLVHLSPQEFHEMEAKHGPHTVNPKTGLPEFGWFGNLLKIIAPIAALAIPGLGEALGVGAAGLFGGDAASLGTVLGTSVVGDLGSAALGAGLGALGGGGKGALIGGLTGGLSSALGPTLSSGLQNMGVGAQTSGALVNAATGAGASAAMGGNPLVGAALAGGMSYLAPQTTAAIQGLGGTSVGSGNTPTLDPTTMTGLSNGPAQGSTVLPDGSVASDAAGAAGLNMNAAATPAVPSAAVATPGASAAGTANNSSTLSKLLPALLLASLAQGNSQKVYTAPPPASNAPAYFGQTLTSTPYIPQYTPTNPNFQGGAYSGLSLGYKKGGALKHTKHISAPSPAALAGSITGAGDGQSDDIPAQLADNEHVFDAATVALAGRGSSTAGHRVMEGIKHEIRKTAGLKHPKKAPMMREMKAGALVRAGKKRAA